MGEEGRNLLAFQKPSAPVASTQINCYLFDPDAFFLLSNPKKPKQKFKDTYTVTVLRTGKQQQRVPC